MKKKACCVDAPLLSVCFMDGIFLRMLATIEEKNRIIDLSLNFTLPFPDDIAVQ